MAGRMYMKQVTIGSVVVEKSLEMVEGVLHKPEVVVELMSMMKSAKVIMDNISEDEDIKDQFKSLVTFCKVESEKFIKMREELYSEIGESIDPLFSKLEEEIDTFKQSFAKKEEPKKEEESIKDGIVTRVAADPVNLGASELEPLDENFFKKSKKNLSKKTANRKEEPKKED